MIAPEKGLPTNVDAERFVLGSILLDDGFYIQAAGTLTPDDFSLEKHRRIFKRIADLADRDEKIDRMTLANELMKFGELEACDGLSYLVSLDDGLPQVPNLESYIRIVKDKAVLRRIIFASQHVMNRCLQAEEAPGEILSGAEETFLELRKQTDATRSRATFGSALLTEVVVMEEQRAKKYLESGRPVMGIATGIKRLDDLINGLNPGLHILGGGPGVGKTTLALQISIKACEQEIPVVYVTYENSPENLILKAVCARAEIDSRKVERGMLHSEERKRFRGAVSELAPMLVRFVAIAGTISLQVADIHSRIVTILRELHVDTCLIVVDFLQRAATGQRGFTEIRNSVSALTARLRDLANDLNSPVLALSSLNRKNGDYGNGAPKIGAPLDALKESGDIEYGADTVMILERTTDRNADPPAVPINLTIRKQRFGPVGNTVNLICRPDMGVFRELTNESFKATV